MLHFNVWVNYSSFCREAGTVCQNETNKNVKNMFVTSNYVLL